MNKQIMVLGARNTVWNELEFVAPSSHHTGNAAGRNVLSQVMAMSPEGPTLLPCSDLAKSLLL